MRTPLRMMMMMMIIIGSIALVLLILWWERMDAISRSLSSPTSWTNNKSPATTPARDSFSSASSSAEEEEIIEDDNNWWDLLMKDMPSYETTIQDEEPLVDIATTNNTIPFGMFLIHEKVLWCPSAKVGTTSIYAFLYDMGLFHPRGERCWKDCDALAWKLFLLQREQKGRNEQVEEVLKSATSFTVVRSPWDRLRSAYVDKIASGHIRPWPTATADTNNNDHDYNIMTFVEFVAHVEGHPKDNVHWMPFSEQCLTFPGNTGGQMYHYDYIIRLEDGLLFETLEEIFFKSGLIKKTNNGTSSSSPLRGIERLKNEHSDEALVEFYRNAATPEMSMEELIKTVGRIYHHDIETFGYSFPEY